MSDHIELHDSRVEVSVAGDAVVLLLRPAYVHHLGSLGGRLAG
jgi:hypothetical protein